MENNCCSVENNHGKGNRKRKSACTPEERTGSDRALGIAAVEVFTIRGGKAPFKSFLTFVGPGGGAPDFAKQVRVCMFQLKNKSSVSHKSQ